MNCILCQSPLTHQIDSHYYQCSRCYAYVKDVAYYFSEAQEKQHYEFHNNDVNDLGYQKFTSPITNEILHRFSTDTLGLDFGCGKGPVITKQLVDRGYHVNLYDPYFYPDQSYAHAVYDYIFSCEVFEHFYQPAKEIAHLKSLLKPGGLLLIMTHLYQEQVPFNSWYYRKDETHVFIYTPQTIAYIAQQFDFEILKLSERFIVLASRNRN
ncbi:MULTISPECIES: class I SAM-dependent methyltransferase [unclassified Myroides]|uniref:class I SAM-dependent methyltransferase n=1 Tax=unclassified Myroides TaxID=2642485 RepID=UPI0015FCE262|nr:MULTISPECIES: class I SAM-dependent methyltransferase [unclassified Myroides]MBB1149406.1 class I SAM-dependent methyltransferase [Myroides sp. NP-2]MDM1406691.1 class I SAM-dependent methyltransferase [Myroides sp. DF42-4-2]